MRIEVGTVLTKKKKKKEKREEVLLQISIIIIYPLTARVFGAPQMISQPVSSIFPLFSTALWDSVNSRPVHSLMLSSHLFLPLPRLIPLPLFHCALQDGWFIIDDDLGRLVVSSCMIIGGWTAGFLMCRPSCILDRQSFGLRMIWMLLALSASCVFPLQLHASLPQAYNWLFSLMGTSCLTLRPPVAMTDG